MRTAKLLVEIELPDEFPEDIDLEKAMDGLLRSGIAAHLKMDASTLGPMGNGSPVEIEVAPNEWEKGWFFDYWVGMTAARVRRPVPGAQIYKTCKRGEVRRGFPPSEYLTRWGKIESVRLQEG